MTLRFPAICAALLLGFTLVMTDNSVSAEDLVLPEKIVLWPDGAPGAKGTEPHDIPTLTHFPAAKRSQNSCAVVICPGGGYRHLANGHEGNDIAGWFNSLGVSAYVLNYRLAPHYQHPAPLQDVQRAIRYVRAHAKEHGVSEDRIGVLGFSAGGHLASTAATLFKEGDPNSADPIEKVSSRPDFAVLCYPVITFTDTTMHRGSRNNLIGENPSEELIQLLSTELQVTPQTPPVFLFHTWEDKGVPPQNSVMFYQAMLKNGVKGELHVFQPGRHGVGLGHEIQGTNQWSRLVELWLKNNGWLTKPQSK